ncbi:MAG: pyruvate kinase [Planctomycetes bacterium]|nr:pyruvate kinase [Planctomycetota bacterium]
MDLRHRHYTERPLVKTKIIATVGPACASRAQLEDLVAAGVDLFRLNFAHGEHDWLRAVLQEIHAISAEQQRPIGVLGDLSGPKIRLGPLPEGGFCCQQGGMFDFVREPDPSDPTKLTSTYDRLIDDLYPGDRVLLADGTVSMRVVEKAADGSRVTCVVEQPGLIRARQGINLPGVLLSTPSLTEKDRSDLVWAVENGLDFVGLSFVRSADDIRQLRSAINELGSEHPPQIVAKIEKMEAVSDLEAILDVTDAVMVARGDLGVEVDIALVPSLQKQIIRMCNLHRIPVITATQMLDSMQTNELPTRAEASDVANAVIDGSDAVMLSGETAVGRHPALAVSLMSRIASEAEKLVIPGKSFDSESRLNTRAKIVTEAVTLGASTAAEHLNADLIAVATHSGKTAMAISKQRSPVPILALTDCPETARRMCLYWGVTPLETNAVHGSTQELIRFVVNWGREQNVLASGNRIVVVAGSDWSAEGHDLMLVHAVE